MKNLVYIVVLVLAIAVAFLLGRSHAPTSSMETLPLKGTSQVLYYVDPMHPTYKSDKPGIAPDCGMDLVPVYAKSMISQDGPGSGDDVRLDAVQQHMIGMKTELVQRSSGSESLRVPGKVVVDDTRVYRINAGVEGWLRKTTDASVGSYVHKDDTLASFYSPEFTALEQGYLVATERMASTTKQLAAPGTQSTSARLRNFGMGEKQIEEIAATRQMPENVNIVAPADGFIIARNVASGQRFDKGIELYRLADLSHVWILAEVVQSEAQYFRPGVAVKVNLPGRGRELQARVSSVLPQFDPESRTMNVRLEANNPGYPLRPEMFVDLEIKVKSPAGLEVPADALLDAGTEQRVYVQRGDGSFEPRAIKIGMRAGDRVEVLSGLQAGERVVVAGTFLLDSESKLKSTNKAQQSNDGHGHAAPPGRGMMTPAHVKAPVEVPRTSGGQS